MREPPPPKACPISELPPSPQDTDLSSDPSQSPPLSPTPKRLQGIRRPNSEEWAQRRPHRGYIWKGDRILDAWEDPPPPSPPPPKCIPLRRIRRPCGEEAALRGRYPRNVWNEERELDMREDLPPPRLEPTCEDGDDYCWDDEWDY